MRKSVYDTDEDGIVDEAEAINDGTNYATASDIKETVDASHTQNTDTKLDEGGANEVSASEIDTALGQAHTQDTDTKLDEGGANEVSASQAKTGYTHSQVSSGNPHNVSKSNVGLGSVPNLNTTDAVNKAHDQNTDTNTSSDDFAIGDGTDTDKTITAQNGDGSEPKLKYNSALNKWQYTDNGTDWFDFGVAQGGAGSGDMLKSTYDTDEDGIVDKAETIDDGAGNSKTAAQVKSHIDSTSNPHSVSKSDVGLSNVDNKSEATIISDVKADEDVSDAISKKHTQNTDTKLNEGGANEVTAINAKDAVTKKHTQNTDTKLDEGGANEVSASQAKTGYTHSQVSSGNPHSVSKSDVGLGNVPNSDTTDAIFKAHTQNTDTGTNQNTFAIGDGADIDKTIEANNGDANAPAIKYNSATNKWQYANDGENWNDIGSGASSGDMLKSTYDTDEDGIVDKAETIDDGAGNAKTAAQIKSHIDSTANPHSVSKSDVGLSNVDNKSEATIISDVKADEDVSDAISKKHTQGTDQALDTGGANEVSASQAKTGYTHSQVSSGNPHGVDKSDVSLGSVPNLNTTDAVNKAHDRSHAIDSSDDHTSTITENNLIDADANGLPDDSGLAVSDASDAISKKHTQNTDTNTSSDDFAIGDGTDTTKTITAQNGDENTPQIRYNSSANAWQYTDNGVDWFDFGVTSGGAGSGDMTKATYDSDEDGIVDEAEAINDGTYSADGQTVLTSSLEFVIDGGGEEIATGIQGDLQVPFDCAIVEAVLLADQSGSIVVDIWKDTYANFPPLVGDSITASAKPTISSTTKDQDSTLTSWTKTISAGDILRFNVDSVTTIERCTVILKVIKS